MLAPFLSALGLKTRWPKGPGWNPAGAAGGKYKAKTVYDFEDDTVEGELQRPDEDLISEAGKVIHQSLIEIRKNFIPEMLKSLEDI